MLSTEDATTVRMELNWLRLRGSTTFVATPTFDAAIAGITASQESLVLALLARIRSVGCAAEDPDNATIKRAKDVEFFEGARGALTVQREDLARQLAAALDLIDWANDTTAPFVVLGCSARPTFADCICTEDES